MVSADHAVRGRMFAAALALLARADHGDLAAWQAAARYLLYQRH